MVGVFTDESGLSFTPYNTKAWAPVGEDPGAGPSRAMAERLGHRRDIARGGVYRKVRKGSIREPQDIAFWHPLQRHIRRRPIMIFWDNAPHPRSQLRKAYWREPPRQVVPRLPGYGPKLNPKECVWAHLKKHNIVSFAPNDKKELKRRVRWATRRMRGRPTWVRKLAVSSKLPGPMLR